MDHLEIDVDGTKLHQGIALANAKVGQFAEAERAEAWKAVALGVREKYGHACSVIGSAAALCEAILNGNHKAKPFAAELGQQIQRLMSLAHVDTPDAIAHELQEEDRKREAATPAVDADFVVKPDDGLYWIFFDGLWEAQSKFHDQGVHFVWRIAVQDDGRFHLQRTDAELTHGNKEEPFGSLAEAKEFCQRHENA